MVNGQQPPPPNFIINHSGVFQTPFFSYCGTGKGGQRERERARTELRRLEALAHTILLSIRESYYTTRVLYVLYLWLSGVNVGKGIIIQPNTRINSCTARSSHSHVSCKEFQYQQLAKD